MLFDLDGTLVDTAPDLGYAANCVRAEAGLPPLPAARYRPVASAGARGLLKVALDLDPGHSDYGRRRESFLRHYRAHIARDSHPFAGIEDALSAFEGRGLRWGVVTNKAEALARPLLEALRLAQRAGCVVGGREGVPLKPAPDLLMEACRVLRLAPGDCVYVGDDRRDVDAARAAGMPVWVAAWGYLGDGEPPEAWGADAIVATPAGLAARLA